MLTLENFSSRSPDAERSPGFFVFVVCIVMLTDGWPSDRRRPPAFLYLAEFQTAQSSFESITIHHAPLAKQAYALVSETRFSEFESRVGHQFYALRFWCRSTQSFFDNLNVANMFLSSSG
jgi:hypothetical protein